MPNPSTTTEAPANTKEKKTAYLICEGALCECAGGSAKVKLKVTSHKKAYINGDKLVATEKDVTFDSPGNFGTCSFMTSPYNTCAPSVQKWLQPYNDIEVENNKVITDKSEMMCTTGGKIKITKHGQTQDVNAEQANNMDRTIAAQVNALADLAPIAEEDKKVSVLSIRGAIVDDPKYKPVTTQENQSIVSITETERKAKKTIEDPADIYVRPGQEVEFIAKPDGTASLVCWKVSGTKDPVHFLQHGPSYQTSFPEVGKYSVEGYGTGKDSFLDIETRLVNGKREDMKEYKDCMLDILVQENKLIDIRHLKSDNIIDVTNKKIVEKAQLRIGVPATFEPVFLMPPIQNEIDELILVIFDESGTELQRTKGQPKLVFVPKNSAAKYTLKAYFDGAEADFISYPFASSLNSVNVIATSNMKVENERIRPGTFVKFTVQNSKFMDDTVAPEIIETENRQIKWYENSETVAGTGPSYEKTYQKEGKYTIVCRVTEGQPGWFTADKNDADDRTFYVTKNYPTAIEKTTTGISKVGRKISFELKGFFNIDYTDKNTIHWELIGPETKETKASPTFEFTPTKKGTYKLYVSMNGGATEHPFKFECTACEIVKGWWTDSDGNMLTGKDDTSDPSNTLGVAGWGQEVCIAFKHIGLGGEVVTIEVWDKDFNGTTSVYTTELTCTEGYNGVKCPLTLDGDLKKNVAKKGASSNGLLYFTVTVNNGLKVVNNGMVLPSGEINYLKVDDTLRAKAYFADNNDTKRYSTASTDMPVYVQVKSTNLIGDELELIIYKSLNWDIDKKYEEKIAFKVDKYGMASVKLDMCIFNEEFSNPNDSISLYVKVLRKSDSEELYSSEGKYPLTLYEKLNTSPASKNTTKAFVMVDTSDGKKNEGSDAIEGCGLIYRNEIQCTKYGNQYGPVYWGSIKLNSYSKWSNLISEGKLTDDEKDILIAMSENEGNLDAVQSYDSEIVTVGAMQKTMNPQGYGEFPIQMWEFKKEFPERFIILFSNCGWDVKEEVQKNKTIQYRAYYQNITGSDLKSNIRAGFEKNNFKSKVQCIAIEPLINAAKDICFQSKQIEDFIDRLKNKVLITIPEGYENKLSDYLKSKLGKATALDHHINRPAHLKSYFGEALNWFHELHSKVQIY
uniref:DUF4280 domain-containing protein n=1 Tax=uncultured Cytophaga sp. TaxID=160238 RepID=UPI00262644F9